jgi:carbon-monoxide dehydrogenase large subunit
MLTGKNFGRPVRRLEDGRFIQGKGRYVDDIILPRQTYAAFVRSPYAHARVLSIDPAPALDMPGVLSVVTGADLNHVPAMPCGWMIHSRDGSEMRVGERRALAGDTVRYVGEPIAVVVAETRDQARDAAETVLVEYEELLVVVDIADAMNGDAVQLHAGIPGNLAFDWGIGDEAATDAAMAQAAHKVSITLRNNRLIPNAIEPRACNCDWDPIEDKLTVWMTHQNPGGMRMFYSAVYGLAAEQNLRVISPDVGGGFGAKAGNYPEELAVAAIAKLAGRPVKWTADRTEAFLTDIHARDHLTTATLGLDANGRFLAFKVDNIANMGGYLSMTGSLIPTYMYATMLSGQYVIPAIYGRTRAVYTNTCPVDAYRGAGRPEAAYVIERIVNVAARALGIDQAEIRRRNFIRDFPYQTPVIWEYDSGDYAAGLAQALKLGDYAGFAARKAEAASREKLRGIGVAAYVEACGIGPSAMLAKLGGGAPMWDSAEVRVNPVGSVEVLSGAHSHGQGHATTIAQVVADRLGVPIENISVIQGDTDRIQAGTGTYGSRASVGMSATLQACDKIIAKGKRICAHLMQVDIDSINFDDGIYSSAATNRTVPFGEMAHQAHAATAFPTREIEPGLVENSFFDPPNFTYPSGVYVAEVEIDPQTGITQVISFSAADDFGVIANPMIVEGQIMGGLTQGIGQALWEECRYDPDTAQLITASFMDYGMPRADSLPQFKLSFGCTPSPSNPLGMKGCGEAGAIGSPPAIMNAICDALDIDHVDMPARPETVWRLCQARGAG